MEINWILTCLCNDTIVDISFAYHQDRTCVWKDEDGSVLLRLEKHDIWWIEDGEAIQLAKQPLRLHTLYPCVVHDASAYIFCEPQDTESRIFHVFMFQKHQQYSIGRTHCDISFDNEFLSEHHADLYYEQQQWWLADCNSTNGTYVNRKRISKVALKFGDCAYFMGLWLVFGDGWIAFNDPLQRVQVDSHVCLPYTCESLHKVTKRKDEMTSLREIIEKKECASYTVLHPPMHQVREKLPVVLMLGPSISMGIASIMSSYFMMMQTYEQTNSIKQAYPSMIMSGSMLMSTMLWPYLVHQYEKRKEAKVVAQRQQVYESYLRITSHDIKQDLQKQKQYLCTLFPKKQERIPLWKYQHVEDVSYVCLGYGNKAVSIPWVKEESRQISLSCDPLLEKRKQFMAQQHYIEEEPIVIELKKPFFLSMYASQEELHAYAYYVLFQLVNLYSPEQLLVVIAGQDVMTELRFLPHSFYDKRRYLCQNQQQARKILQTLSEILIPVVVISHHPIFTKLFSPYIQKSKKSCLFALHEEETFHQVYIERETAVFQQQSIQWKEVSKQEWEMLIQSYHQTNEHSFPSKLGFLAMYEVTTCEHLDIEKRWARAKPDQQLRAAIGVYENQECCYLDIHEKAHGPHGILAGMTGSGKSELLISLLLSFAISYHPYDVSFILIDYKGGGMAKTLESLPHTAGIITNLDGSMIARSLLALDSELLRRQKIFIDVMKQLEVSSMDIYIYQKCCKENQGLEPLPHIIIAADEFAELKQQQPAFMEQLIRLARIGRSLGIHLLLATQKPSGVVDEQIWSNAHFHICMKVADKSDSMDMLKRDDGAFLTNSGRFYLQVGYDELFEEGQAAYAKMPYQEGVQIQDAWIKQVDELKDTIHHWTKEPLKETKMNEVQAILAYIQTIAQRRDIKPRMLWLPQLQPYRIDQDAKKDWIAIVDDPVQQRQFPLTIHSNAILNTLLYASNRKDQIQALQAIVYALLFRNSPSQLCIIFIDMTSHDGRRFASLPHTYAYICEEECEDMQYIFAWLQKQLQIRKKEPYTQDIVIILHHYAAFREQYEAMEDVIYSLLRDGKDYGIHLIVTLQSLQDMRYRYLNLFSQIFCFALHKDEEIFNILGVQKQIPSCTGRALWKIQEIYEVQFVSHEKKWLENKLSELHNQVEVAKMPVLEKHLIKEIQWLETQKHMMIGIQKQQRQPMFLTIEEPWILMGPKAQSLLKRIEQVHKQYHLSIHCLFAQEGIHVEDYPSSTTLIYVPSSMLATVVYSDWFMKTRAKGNCLWIGKGCKEIRYLFDIQEECKDGEDYDGYWITTSCIPVRFMEER